MRDVNQLHPRAKELALKLIETCAKKGITIKIGECLRTVAEQDALYAQGRTAPGSKVTNCKGSTYSSMHQWGVAFDFFLSMDVDGDGSVSDDAFNDSTGLFEKVGEIGKSLGLEWGGDWVSIKDRPHFQLPDWGSTATKLKDTYGTFEAFKRTWSLSGAPTITPESVPVQQSTNGSGIITAANGVNIRSTPDNTTSANKLGAIPNGKSVTIIQLNAATACKIVWARVTYGTYTGYVAQKYINITKYPQVTTEDSTAATTYSKSVVEPAGKKDAKLSGTYKTTANLNLRVGAGTNKDIVLTIPKGKAVSNYGYYTEKNGTKWLLVVYGKYTGFVSTGYLKKTT